MKLTHKFCCAALLVSSSLSAQSLTLSEAESIAVEQNENLMILKEQLQASRQRRLQAISAWLPSVTASAQYNKSEKSSSVTNDDFTTTSIALSQPLFSSTLYFQSEIAGLSHQAVEHDFVALQQTVLFNVRDSYFNQLLAQEELSVQKENTSLLNSQVKRQEQLFELGETTTLELQQSRVEAANALSDLYQAKKNLKIARNTLQRTLGYTASSQEDIVLSDLSFPVLSHSFIANKIHSFSPDRQIFTEAEIRALEKIALKSRPEIKKKKAELLSAKQTLRASYGKYLPELSAFAGYDTSSASSFFSTQNDSWRGGITLSWSLFNGLGRERKIKENAALQRAVEIDYLKLEEDVRVEVQNTLHSIEEALLSYFSAKDAVAFADEAIDQAKDQRDLGLITPLQYRDIAASHTKAKQNFNRASYQLLVSYYSLLKVTASNGIE